VKLPYGVLVRML